MLPPFIIEQIRKREEEEARREQPVLELPIPLPQHPAPAKRDDEGQRGVVIIDI